MLLSSRVRSGRGDVTASRLDFIDGLRALACLYVVMDHLFLLWPVAAGTRVSAEIPVVLLTKVAAFGHIGVDVFLALSGFCLFYPLCRRSSGLSPSGLPALQIRAYALR